MAGYYDSHSPEQQKAILEGPAVEPPDDSIKPDFLNPSSQNTAPRIIAGFCLAVNTVLVVARVYGRCIVLKSCGLADYLIIPAYILFVAYVSILFYLVDKYGYFIHIWDIQLKNVLPILHNYLISTILYTVALSLVKAAILLEWLQIFVPKGTRNLFFWCAHLLLWANTLFYLSATVVVLASWIPAADDDVTQQLPGMGIHDVPLDVASAAVNFLIDLGILLLPQGVIWRLNMSSRSKIDLSVIFGLGVLAIIAAGYRAGYTISVRHSDDTTWNHSLASILLTVEMTCGFGVVCLPACPKAVQAARTSIRLLLEPQSGDKVSV